MSQSSSKVLVDVIRTEIQASISVKQLLISNQVVLHQVADLALQCIDSLRSGGKIIFAGNGGSFADAQHLSAEFTSRFKMDRAPLASVALGTNSSAMSAIGNDYGYEHVFARELQGIASSVDIFIPITTSGNSLNMVYAAEMAKRIGLTTIAWTGETGGKMHDICDCIRVPHGETARIQECHILIGHILCGLVEREYFLTMGGRQL